MQNEKGSLPACSVHRQTIRRSDLFCSPTRTVGYGRVRTSHRVHCGGIARATRSRPAVVNPPICLRWLAAASSGSNLLCSTVIDGHIRFRRLRRQRPATILLAIGTREVRSSGSPRGYTKGAGIPSTVFDKADHSMPTAAPAMTTPPSSPPHPIIDRHRRITSARLNVHGRDNRTSRRA